MPDILVITDDGLESLGFKVLMNALQNHYKGSRIVGFGTKDPKSGQSFSVSPRVHTDGPHVNFQQKEDFLYEVEGTPVDCLYLAMLWPEEFLGMNLRFNHMFSGVNFGHNVGVDVVHSGTVACAALGASAFGLPSVAFSQEISPEIEEKGQALMDSKHLYRTSEAFIPKILQQLVLMDGVCYNVNFPKEAPKGYKMVPHAQYSRWLPSMNQSLDKTSDIVAVNDGFITTTQLEMTMAPFVS